MDEKKIKALDVDLKEKALIEYSKKDSDFLKFLEINYSNEELHYSRLCNFFNVTEFVDNHEAEEKLKNYFDKIELFIKSPKKILELIHQFFKRLISFEYLNTYSSKATIFGFYPFVEKAKILFIENGAICNDKKYVINLLHKTTNKKNFEYMLPIFEKMNDFINKEDIQYLIKVYTTEIKNIKPPQYKIIIMTELFRQLPDPILFEQFNQRIESRRYYNGVDKLANVYYDSNDYVSALRILKTLNNYDSFSLNLFYRIYEAQGDVPNKIDVVTKLYYQYPSIDNLNLLLSIIGENKRQFLIDNKILELLKSEEKTNLLNNILFMFDVNKIEEVNEYCLKHVNDFNIWDIEDTLILDKLFESNNKLCISLIYRRQLLEILDSHKVEEHMNEIAVNKLIKLDDLSKEISDYLKYDNHKIFLNMLMIKYKKNKKFWYRYNYLKKD
ncbi:MAG: hypothetical protein EOL97_00020 [Spirochaetia bacterium]|nr:hypothetical protein [Spirochaetia bacterium]